MKLPEKFRLIFKNSNNKAVVFLPVAMVLYASKKNDHIIGPKLSDKDGSVAFTRLECINEIENSKRLFLMDYSSSLEECRPEILIKVLTVKDIDNIMESKQSNPLLFKNYYPNQGQINSLLNKALKCTSYKPILFNISENQLLNNTEISFTIDPVQ